MTAQRLPKGGHIDRTCPLTFHWDGTPMIGYAGDTLASALMANGEQILGRSFKYHRPRGIMSAGVEESGALVTVGQGAKQDANVEPLPNRSTKASSPGGRTLGQVFALILAP